MEELEKRANKVKGESKGKGRERIISLVRVRVWY